jgi:hypothetical protein
MIKFKMMKLLIEKDFLYNLRWLILPAAIDFRAEVIFNNFEDEPDQTSASFHRIIKQATKIYRCKNIQYRS